MKNFRKFRSVAFAGVVAMSIFACSDDDETIGEKIVENVTKGELLATNNNNGNVTLLEVDDVNDVKMKGYLTSFTAADGLSLDTDENVLLMADRTNNRLVGFKNWDEKSDGANLTTDFVFTSSIALENPREIAQNGDFYVVADNQNKATIGTTNRLFIYTKTGSNISLRNVVSVDFAVWGITFVDNQLYAIVDQTGDLAVFNDFLNNNTNTTIAPTKRITIEGITRTHGIVVRGETMILTDIGSAASSTDGAFHLVENFKDKINALANGGTMPISGNQTVVEGSNTLMGNPVDVDYDRTTNTVFIAEAANGKILAFENIGSGGNLTPVINFNMPSASSVYFSRK